MDFNRKPAGLQVKSPTLGHAPGNPTTAPAEITEETVESPKAPEAPEVDESVYYSCAPLERLKIGRFQFDKGQLKLDENDAGQFDALLEKVDARTRSKVKKIDVKAAEAFLRNLKPVATKATDSSSDGAEQRRLVGTKELGKD